MATWSDSETFKLIEIWGEDTNQAQLERCRRNKEIYEKIARDLSDAGYQRTADQCREKVKKLKSEYRKVKDGHYKTGTGRNNWRFLDALDAVIGDKPSTKPPVVIDSLDDNDVAAAAVSVQVVDHTEEEHAGKESSDGSTSLDVLETEPQSGSKLSNTPVKSRSATPIPEEKKGNRKRPLSEDKIEKMMGPLVDRLLKAQESSDRMYLDLEEKRMKMEERMNEREERQKREQREFQLKLFSIMMGEQVSGASSDQSQASYDTSAMQFYSNMYTFEDNPPNV